MKKFGFTMAELIITMSIIGVSAALIAPALTNIVPDKNKVKVLRYNSLLGNAINDLLGNENLYHPHTVVNEITGAYGLSCVGLQCIAQEVEKNPSLISVEHQIKSCIGVDDDNTMSDGSAWTFEAYDTYGFKITIDVDTKKTGCCMSAADCEPNKADTYIYKIDRHGSISASDAMTDAYLRNPYNMSDRKKDYEKAKSLRNSITY